MKGIPYPTVEQFNLAALERWGRPRHDPPRNSQGIHPERTFKMNAEAVSQEYQGEEDGRDI